MWGSGTGTVRGWWCQKAAGFGQPRPLPYPRHTRTHFIPHCTVLSYITHYPLRVLFSSAVAVEERNRRLGLDPGAQKPIKFRLSLWLRLLDL